MSPVPDGGGRGGGGGGYGPVLSIQPASAVFGNVPAGVVRTIDITLRCNGNTGQPISGTLGPMTGNASFTKSRADGFFSIIEGGTLVITITVTNVAAVGAIVGNLHLFTNDGTHDIPFSATIVAAVPLQPIPPSIAFPDLQKVQTKSAAQIIGLFNSTGGSVHVSAITFDNPMFALDAVVSLPATILTLATLSFGIAFTPTALGSSTGNMTIVNDAGAGDIVVPLSGVAVLLNPVAIVRNLTRGILFGFKVDPSNDLKVLDPTMTDSELDCTLIPNGTIWSSAGNEKTLERVQLFYENVGVCTTLEVTASAFRPNPDGSDNYELSVKTVQIGSVAADGSVRSKLVDVSITGEIIVLQVVRKANGGPCSLIGYTPHFADKGEVEGT